MFWFCRKAKPYATRKQLDRALREIAELKLAIEQLPAKIRREEFGRLRPGEVRHVFLGETDMRGFKFALQLPPVPEQVRDIASSELFVTIDAQEAISLAPPPSQGAVEDGRFVAREGATVLVDYRYVDTAGNVSASSTATFTVIDTIPPPMPGLLGLTAIEEVELPAPPEPSPEPQPEPTPDEPLPATEDPTNAGTPPTGEPPQE